jgi:Rnl2 family RNA ligase
MADSKDVPTTQWVKYRSIENAYREKTIGFIKEMAPNGEQWVVTEKVHGANLSFVTDGTTVKMAKRTSVMETEKNRKAFYNSEPIFEKYSPLVLELFAQHELKDASTIVVYGELFGGWYPGIEQKKGSQKVQKGVSYCPQNEFYAFDLLVDGEFVSYDLAVTLFDRLGFYHAAVLYRGTFDQVLAWSKAHYEDVSTVPAMFGLPELDGNVREGHVLKPVTTRYLDNGDRVILKDKNDKFKEKASIKGNVYKEKPLSDEVKTALAEALAYVTEQRYDNVVSKIGTVTKKDTGRLIQLLFKDVLDEFYKDHKYRAKGTDKKDFNRELKTACRKLILPKL